MRAKEREHLRECAELKRELDGTAEELISRVQKLTGGGDAFDVWAHSLRHACANPGNEQAREYCFAAMRELVGDTREEAIAEFHRFSAISPQEQSGSPSLVKNQGSELRLLGNTPHKTESTDSATPGPKAGATFSESEVKSCQSHAIASPIPTGSKPAPKVRPSGAATFQGMEFSVKGLDEDQINALLSIKEGE